jgi:hypothetical protein
MCGPESFILPWSEGKLDSIRELRRESEEMENKIFFVKMKDLILLSQVLPTTDRRCGKVLKI